MEKSSEKKQKKVFSYLICSEIFPPEKFKKQIQSYSATTLQILIKHTNFFY